VKVLYLTDSLSDLDGVGRYGLRLVQALERERPGFEPRILLARKHRPTSDQVPAHWPVEVALPPDYFYYMDPSRFWPSFALGVLRTWRAARGVDLIHAIKDYPHSMIAVTAARLAGVPCVGTGHGTYTVQPLLDARHAARARRTYSRLAGMISVSRYTRRRLLEELAGEALAPEDVRVVPNCVDAAHYVEPRAIGHRPWHDAPFTVAIGEVKERKGHHLWLEAWCRLAGEHPDLHHWVVGNLTPDAYLDGLRARAAEAGLADRVHFLGNVTEDEKVDLLQRALVFVHTPVTASDGGFEGFGIVYLEAAASGTPAIGTLDCGAEDAIVDGETGLLVAQEPAAVEAALRSLLDDPARAEAMGRAARVQAAGRGWGGNARAVLALYDEVLG
jgi:phosphatidylinositol alpha-1,6-mannosyltransferase